MQKAIEFLEFAVRMLVDHPEHVKVEGRTDEMGVLLSLRVHPSDMGKVIGKEGHTAKALRVMLRVVGMKENARVNLKIVEPEGSAYQKNHKSDILKPHDKEEIGL